MGHSFRLRWSGILSAIPLWLLAPPVSAEVCDKVLGDWAPSWLTHAPLWVYFIYEIGSPLNLVLIAIATLAIVDRGISWLALVAAIPTAFLSYVSIRENLDPHIVLQSATSEGCGGSYLSAAIVTPIMTVLLLASFLYATTRKRKH